MKSFVAATLAGVSILGGIGSLALVATEADARPSHHHRGARVGVYIGAPIIAAPFYHHHRPYYRP